MESTGEDATLQLSQEGLESRRFKRVYHLLRTCDTDDVIDNANLAILRLTIIKKLLPAQNAKELVTKSSSGEDSKR